VDLVSQIRAMREKGMTSYNESAVQSLKKTQGQHEVQSGFQWMGEQVYQPWPLYRSEPFNGLGGPANRPSEHYIPDAIKAKFLEKIAADIQLAKAEGRTSDEVEFERMKAAIFQQGDRELYFENIKKLILGQEDLIVKVASHPKTSELRADHLSIFLQFAKGETDLSKFLLALEDMTKVLPERDDICLGKDTETLSNDRYRNVCVFHLLVEKIGYPQPSLPGEAYLRNDADQKLAAQGIRTDVYPSHSFVTENASLAEYLFKQAVCGPSLSDADEVIKMNSGWDLKFVPFSIVSLNTEQRREVCQPHDSEGHFDPFKPVKMNGVQYRDAIHFLTQNIDPLFLEMSFEKWWESDVKGALLEKVTGRLETSIATYKEDVVENELIPALGLDWEGETSFGNYVPYSIDPTNYSVGDVPLGVVPSVLFEIETYFGLILDTIVSDERHPMATTDFIEEKGILKETDGLSEREKNQKGKMNLYRILKEQLFGAFRDLMDGRHTSLTDLKNRYVYTRDSLLDLETFLNLSTDEYKNSLGINVLIHDSHQFVSFILIERMKRLAEDSYRLMLTGAAFDPVLPADFEDSVPENLVEVL
ncbi:MAG: hypothetical protein AAF203_08280, partial [Pseudomonadota bacterium]